jgi:nucleotide-binding universal stress UspA family protein
MNSQQIIIVGVGDQNAMPVLDWAATLANSGDTMRLVHAYEPARNAAVTWQLPVESPEVLRAVAARHVVFAAAALKRRRRDLVVEGAVLTRAPEHALVEFSHDADIVAVGRTHGTRSRDVLRRLLARTSCPVLVVPDAEPDSCSLPAPVVVLVTDLASEHAVVHKAFSIAAERHSGLTALCCSASEPAGSEPAGDTGGKWTDDLAAWQPDFPTVPVRVLTFTGEAAAALGDYADDPGLLVMGHRQSARWTIGGGDRVSAAVLDERRHPTLLVPVQEAGTTGSALRPAQGGSVVWNVAGELPRRPKVTGGLRPRR